MEYIQHGSTQKYTTPFIRSTPVYFLKKCRTSIQGSTHNNYMKYTQWRQKIQNRDDGK
jgi:hypothetical protein